MRAGPVLLPSLPPLAPLPAVPEVVRDTAVENYLRSLDVALRARERELGHFLDELRRATADRLERIRIVANEGISLGDTQSAGNIQGVWRSVVTPATAYQEFSVTHGLKAVPKGFLYQPTAQYLDSGFPHTGTIGPVSQLQTAVAGTDTALDTGIITVAEIPDMPAEIGSGGLRLVFGGAMIENMASSRNGYMLYLYRGQSVLLKRYHHNYDITAGDRTFMPILWTYSTAGRSATSFQLRVQASSSDSGQVALANSTWLIVAEVAGSLSPAGITTHSAPPDLMPSGTPWTEQEAYFRCTKANFECVILLWV